MIDCDQRTIQVSDGASVSYRCWYAEQPQAFIHILHGMSEHSGRYSELAKYLVNSGFQVYAHDHRGHGETAAIKDLGNWPDNGWSRVLADVGEVNQMIHNVAGEAPVFLVGHSMGSFIALGYAIQKSETISKLVLSGSSFVNPAVAYLAKTIPKVEAVRMGPEGKSFLVHAMSFGSYNRKFQPTRTAFDWLTREPHFVEEYIADVKCGFMCSNKLWLELLGGMAEIFSSDSQKNIRADLPVYILGGALDPVGGSSGLSKLAESLTKSGLERVDLRLYPEGRHEMFNETNRTEVYEDLVQWLKG